MRDRALIAASISVGSRSEKKSSPPPRCCHQGCQGKRWDDVPGAEDDVTVAGYLGVVAGSVAAVLTLIVAVGYLRGRFVSPRAARRALVVALATMGYFLLRNLIDGGRLDPDPSWGGFVAIAAAIGAHQALRRLA